jgi:hypothetical protein
LQDAILDTYIERYRVLAQVIAAIFAATQQTTPLQQTGLFGIRTPVPFTPGIRTSLILCSIHFWNQIYVPFTPGIRTPLILYYIPFTPGIRTSLILCSWNQDISYYVPKRKAVCVHVYAST